MRIFLQSMFTGIQKSHELADVEIDSVFGDVQAVSNLVDRVFKI